MSDSGNNETQPIAVPSRPANPDGKGLAGVMLDLVATTPRGVVAKPRPQLLAEFFTSMLVLSARFGHKPSVGVSNYLYFVDGNWQLSLIAPEEWSAKRREGFAGTCVLQRDMTWTIDPSERLAQQTPVADAILRFYEAFAAALQTDLPLEAILPFHAAGLPYRQRIAANALSRSLRESVTLGDQRAVRARDWLARLPGVGRLLLPGSD